MCDKSIQWFIQSQAKESAKNIHLNVTVRAGVIGAVFWELQLAKYPTVHVERERER